MAPQNGPWSNNIFLKKSRTPFSRTTLWNWRLCFLVKYFCQGMNFFNWATEVISFSFSSIVGLQNLQNTLKRTRRLRIANSACAKISSVLWVTSTFKLFWACNHSPIVDFVFRFFAFGLSEVHFICSFHNSVILWKLSGQNLPDLPNQLWWTDRLKFTYSCINYLFKSIIFTNLCKNHSLKYVIILKYVNFSLLTHHNWFGRSDGF